MARKRYITESKFDDYLNLSDTDQDVIIDSDDKMLYVLSEESSENEESTQTM